MTHWQTCDDIFIFKESNLQSCYYEKDSRLGQAIVRGKLLTVARAAGPELLARLYNGASDKRKKSILWDVENTEKNFLKVVGKAPIKFACYVGKKCCGIVWAEYVTPNSSTCAVHFFFDGSEEDKIFIPYFGQIIFYYLARKFKMAIAIVPAHWFGAMKVLAYHKFKKVLTMSGIIGAGKRDGHLYAKKLFYNIRSKIKSDWLYETLVYQIEKIKSCEEIDWETFAEEPVKSKPASRKTDIKEDNGRQEKATIKKNKSGKRKKAAQDFMEPLQIYGEEEAPFECPDFLGDAFDDVPDARFSAWD